MLAELAAATAAAFSASSAAFRRAAARRRARAELEVPACFRFLFENLKTYFFFKSTWDQCYKTFYNCKLRNFLIT
jgi:hypothetical protein